MKIFFLLSYGRAGVDLLQSLLDGHKQISQFPGFFNWPEFYKKINNINNLEIIADTFIEKQKHFFDSRLNEIEQHDKLGKNRDEYYIVDKKTFKNNFINLFKSQKVNIKNIFFNLHLAYSSASGENIEKKKIIIFNLHAIDYFEHFEDFEYEFIINIRHPIAALSSSAKHWNIYKSGKFTSPWQLYYLINRVFKLLKYFIETKKRFHIIKLESLHLQSVKTLKNLSKITEIDFQDSLMISSYHKKIWWGDQLSKKYLDGLNPNFKNNIDYNYFFKKDLALIHYYLRDIFKGYGYEKIQNKKYYFLYLLKFLPLKIELIFLKRQIKNLNFKNIILFFFYWFKRISIMKNDLYKNLNLPTDITNI